MANVQVVPSTTFDRTPPGDTMTVGTPFKWVTKHVIKVNNGSKRTVTINYTIIGTESKGGGGSQEASQFTVPKETPNFVFTRVLPVEIIYRDNSQAGPKTYQASTGWSARDLGNDFDKKTKDFKVQEKPKKK